MRVGRGAAFYSGVRRTRSVAVSVVAVVMAIAGLSAASLLWHPATLSQRAAVEQAGGNRIHDDVPTSFGLVTVESVRHIDGLTHRSLAGVTHGVSGLVSSRHAQVQVAVAITNRTARPIHYTSERFALRTTRPGIAVTYAVRGGDLPDSRLRPHAAIEGHLTFTIPREDANLVLVLRDPARATPTVIHLGPATFQASGGDAHTH
jgi:hypothetical protein